MESAINQVSSNRSDKGGVDHSHDSHERRVSFDVNAPDTHHDQQGGYHQIHHHSSHQSPSKHDPGSHNLHLQTRLKFQNQRHEMTTEEIDSEQTLATLMSKIVATSMPDDEEVDPYKAALVKLKLQSDLSRANTVINSYFRSYPIANASAVGVLFYKYIRVANRSSFSELVEFIVHHIDDPYMVQKIPGKVSVFEIAVRTLETESKVIAKGYVSYNALIALLHEEIEKCQTAFASAIQDGATIDLGWDINSNYDKSIKRRYLERFLAQHVEVMYVAETNSFHAELSTDRISIGDKLAEVLSHVIRHGPTTPWKPDGHRDTTATSGHSSIEDANSDVDKSISSLLSFMTDIDKRRPGTVTTQTTGRQDDGGRGTYDGNAATSAESSDMSIADEDDSDHQDLFTLRPMVDAGHHPGIKSGHLGFDSPHPYKGMLRLNASPGSQFPSSDHGIVAAENNFFATEISKIVPPLATANMAGTSADHSHDTPRLVDKNGFIINQRVSPASSRSDTHHPTHHTPVNILKTMHNREYNAHNSLPVVSSGLPPAGPGHLAQASPPGSIFCDGARRLTPEPCSSSVEDDREYSFAEVKDEWSPHSPDDAIANSLKHPQGNPNVRHLQPIGPTKLFAADAPLQVMGNSAGIAFKPDEWDPIHDDGFNSADRRGRVGLMQDTVSAAFTGRQFNQESAFPVPKSTKSSYFDHTHTSAQKLKVENPKIVLRRKPGTELELDDLEVQSTQPVLEQKDKLSALAPIRGSVPPVSHKDMATVGDARATSNRPHSRSPHDSDWYHDDVSNHKSHSDDESAHLSSVHPTPPSTSDRRTKVYSDHTHTSVQKLKQRQGSPSSSNSNGTAAATMPSSQSGLPALVSVPHIASHAAPHTATHSAQVPHAPSNVGKGHAKESEHLAPLRMK